MRYALAYAMVFVLAATPAGNAYAEADADRPRSEQKADSVLDELAKKLRKPVQQAGKDADKPADAAKEAGESDDATKDAAEPGIAVEPTERPKSGANLAPAIKVGVDPRVLGLPPGMPAPELRREGDYVRMRRGRIVGSAEGDCAVFVFESDDEKAPLPPMVLVRCNVLQGMEDLVHKRGDRFLFTLSGQILQYRGVNYLLPTMQRPPTAAPKTDDKDNKAPRPSDEVLKKLRQKMKSGPLINSSSPEPDDPVAQPEGAPQRSAAKPGRMGVAPGKLAVKPMREGQYIRMRRGRIARSPHRDGVLFVFDSDTPAMTDAPIAIVPCQALQSMEEQVQKLGDRTVFILSGQVLEYRGENYLIPTMMKLAIDRGNLRR